MGDVPSSISSLTTAQPTAAEPQESRSAMESRVRQMAQQFESLLLTKMLQQMRQTMLSDEEGENGLGKDTFTDSIDTELGNVLSKAGGFGLANELSKALARRLGTDADAASVGSPTATSVAPSGTVPVLRAPAPAEPATAAAPDASDSSTLEPSSADGLNLRVPHGRVSSAYGWRQDPINGAPRFHNGIDVAQAYGQDVKAAAAGRVAFSGDRGSYGSTIIVEHPGGRRTLYAHLSTLDVREGDVVDAGQVIGKSGSSGRSTGPHLHFEVLESGHPVDPSAAS
jgi:murein DD-endopeptidase MepM/ murein hydrolase activator NlpD